MSRVSDILASQSKKEDGLRCYRKKLRAVALSGNPRILPGRCRPRRPDETQPVLVVDRDGVLPETVFRKSVQPFPGGEARSCKLVAASTPELCPHSLEQVGREALRPPPSVHILGKLVVEALDHRTSLLQPLIHVSSGATAMSSGLYHSLTHAMGGMSVLLAVSLTRQSRPADMDRSGYFSMTSLTIVRMLQHRVEGCRGQRSTSAEVSLREFSRALGRAELCGDGLHAIDMTNATISPWSPRGDGLPAGTVLASGPPMIRSELIARVVQQNPHLTLEEGEAIVAPSLIGSAMLWRQAIGSSCATSARSASAAAKPAPAGYPRTGKAGDCTGQSATSSFRPGKAMRARLNLDRAAPEPEAEVRRLLRAS